MPVVDRDEVYEILVLLNVDIELLNRSGVGVDIFLDGRLRLKEAL